MIPKSIKNQIKKGKNNNVEFIAKVDDFVKIIQTVCGFLNKKGGTVFCGVDNNNKIITNSEIADRSNEIRKKLQEEVTPKAPLLSVTFDKDDKNSLISIEVPEGLEKPYIYNDIVYVRQGQSVRTANSALLRQIVQSKSIKAERWERQLSISLEENELDKNEINKTVKECENSGRFFFKNLNNNFAILKELALTNSWQFTQAADVLFGKNPAVRHPQIRVRATCFTNDKDSDEFIDDQIYQGPLVTVLDNVFNFIKRNTKVSVTFNKEKIRTIDQSEYPALAIREGLVNAFAHRDYSAFSGGVSVNIYPKKIEIWNSGRLPEGLDPSKLKTNHPSIPINPDIVHVLYIRGLMNRIGRGTQNIVRLCKENNLPSPKWKDTPHGVTLTLFASSILSSKQSVFNKRQAEFLKSIKSGEVIRPYEYRNTFAKDVSERQARRDLNQLKKSNFLEKISGSHYRRTNRTYIDIK